MIRRRQKSFTGFYHVIVKGINKEQIFNQQREKVYFKKTILEFLEKYEVDIYAYCIMSNHTHLLVRADAVEELSSFMARILAKYANYYNFKHNRNGHVFQNRFVSECVDSEAYYWNCIRYIHLNPVKAKMVKNAVRYKYSSLGEYFTDTANLISKKALEMYKKQFNSYAVFEEFHTRRQQELYADIPDEMEMQKLEVARMIAEEIFEQKKVAVLQQVFEEKILREEYINRLQQILKVSKRNAREICISVKNAVENE